MQGKRGLCCYLKRQMPRLSHYLLSLGTQNTNPPALADRGRGDQGDVVVDDTFFFFGLWEFKRLLIRCASFARCVLAFLEGLNYESGLLFLFICRFLGFTFPVRFFPSRLGFPPMLSEKIMLRSSTSIGHRLTVLLFCCFNQTHYSSSFSFSCCPSRTFRFRLICVEITCPQRCFSCCSCINTFGSWVARDVTSCKVLMKHPGERCNRIPVLKKYIKSTKKWPKTKSIEILLDFLHVRTKNIHVCWGK